MDYFPQKGAISQSQGWQESRSRGPRRAQKPMPRPCADVPISPGGAKLLASTLAAYPLMLIHFVLPGLRACGTH